MRRLAAALAWLALVACGDTGGSSAPSSSQIPWSIESSSEDELVRVCVAADTSAADQAKILHALVQTGDVRIGPCLSKVLDNYQPNQNEADMQVALKAILDRKLTDATPSVMRFFRAIEHSQERAELCSLVAKTLFALVDPTYGDELIAIIKAPIDSRDPWAAEAQLFWQRTAIRLLGKLRIEKAVEPLLQVLLSPSKAALHRLSQVALAQIGEATIPPVLRALQNNDDPLNKFSEEAELAAYRQKYPESGGPNLARRHGWEQGRALTYVRVLASSGSGRVVEPLSKLIAEAETAFGLKASFPIVIHRGSLLGILALALVDTPHTHASKQIFRDVVATLIPRGPTSFLLILEWPEPEARGIAEVLVDEACRFFDASFVPELVETVQKNQPGSAARQSGFHTRTYRTALKLMTREQASMVERYWRTIRTKEITSELSVGEALKSEREQTLAILERCGETIGCYLKQLASPASQQSVPDVASIKAAYMLGVLGNAEVVQPLLEVLPSVTDDGVRQVVLGVLEHFLPTGDAGVADKLEALYDSATASRSEQDMDRHLPLLATAARLRMRLRDP